MSDKQQWWWDASSSGWNEPPSAGRPPPVSAGQFERQADLRQADLQMQANHRWTPPVHVAKAHPTEEQMRDFMWSKDYASMPKRMKILEKGFRHMEANRMQKEDRDSDLRGALEFMTLAVKEVVVQERIVEEKIVERIVIQEKVVVEEKIVKVYVEKDADATEPLFRAGQSVHQWWAGWMAGTADAPAGIKGKARPAWFSSSVFAGTALSPSMPRCRNDRNFTRHQLSEMFQGPACRPAC